MIIMILSSNLTKIKYLLLIAIVVFSFSSCVNEDEQLGLSLVKSNGGMDILHSPDGLATISTFTYKSDSLQTRNRDNFVLGSYRDEQFGLISTDIYTNLSLENSAVNFPGLGTVDSVVLCLAYSGVFAKDTNIKSTTMNVRVQLLSEDIDTSNEYITGSVATQSDYIFNANVRVAPSEGVILGTDTTETAPHMRLKLSDDFTNTLANSSFESREAFNEIYKGIKISATSQNNDFLAYITMTSANSGIYVYYHTKSGALGHYIISFPSSGERFMHVERDYSSSMLSELNTKKKTDTITTQDYIYVASLGVAEAKLNLAGIDSWYNQDSIKGAALNRAELILPVASISGNTGHYPSALLTFYKQDGKYYYLPDILATNNFLGNKYDATINAYRIDLTSYLQNYLLGKYDNCEIYIVPDGRISSASRVILNGTNSSNPPKLNIIYSHPATN